MVLDVMIAGVKTEKAADFMESALTADGSAALTTLGHDHALCNVSAVAGVGPPTHGTLEQVRALLVFTSSWWCVVWFVCSRPPLISSISVNNSAAPHRGATEETT